MTTNRLVLVLTFLFFLPICAKSQEKASVSRPTVPRQACPRLEAKQNIIPDGEAGALIKQALGACKDYRARKLTEDEWSEQLVTIEEHAAFLNPPPGFAGIIPFSDAGLFEGFDTYSLFLFPSVEWTNKKDEV